MPKCNSATTRFTCFHETGHTHDHEGYDTTTTTHHIGVYAWGNDGLPRYLGVAYRLNGKFRSKLTGGLI